MLERGGVCAAAAAALEERISLSAPTRRLRFALVVEVLERHAKDRAIRLLDAGCGDGLLSLAIAHRRPSWEIVGIDMREDLLAGARERARGRGLANVRFVRADLVEPLPESGFDAVLAVECLTEIPDDHSALRVLSAALRQSGILIAHVPERSWKPILPGSSPIWREEVRHGYTSQEIAEALRAAGMGSVKVRPTMRGTVAVAQEIRDRIKMRSLAVRALAFPAMVVAVNLERSGITWGPDRALLATGLRPSDRPGGTDTVG
ncbi:MAG: class I SAM-dependent methyltransferase [Solirubrobacteraceae bacterium]